MKRLRIGVLKPGDLVVTTGEEGTVKKCSLITASLVLGIERSSNRLHKIMWLDTHTGKIDTCTTIRDVDDSMCWAEFVIRSGEITHSNKRMAINTPT